MGLNNPSIIQCVHMVHRLVAQGYSKTKAITVVASAYGVPAGDLATLVEE